MELNGASNRLPSQPPTVESVSQGMANLQVGSALPVVPTLAPLEGTGSLNTMTARSEPRTQRMRQLAASLANGVLNDG